MRCFLSLLLAAASASVAHAARYAEVRIERGGVLVLKAMLTLPDIQEKADSWMELNGVTLEPVGPALAELAKGNPTLKGDLRVVMTWGAHQTPVLELKPDELRLAPKEGGGNRWLIPEEELKRVGRAAGLDVDSRPLPEWIFALFAIIIGAIVLGGMMVWQWRRSEKLAALDRP